MPNHITNIIEASPKVIESMLNEEGYIDFNCAIPRHEDLSLNDADSVCSVAESAAQLMCKEKISDNELLGRMQLVNQLRSSALDMSDETFEQFVMMMRNKRNHGHYHMMDFARTAWGTKWNAYGQNPENNKGSEVRFKTAWSHPKPVIIALSKKLPEEKISIKYADEDTGSNCGTYIIQNGEMLICDIAPNWNEQSQEQKRKYSKFAFQITKPEMDPREYGYNEDWDYDEAVSDQYWAERDAAEESTKS
ncbi:hypothetical protein L1077_21745 [Pseudoalteromonas luteoviolacea]|uniref:DUF1281 family ferredoxin-like fold protein n=1 Tax=Pseudoalteromonas luteoviolacea TaxID=43657 RepID=UPI001F2FB228|nr:hypothetical protein [Pseudoalteromonas luteoviolacea]MCF6442058.1 hypothetical protein [Pseudoalteromonas luteoviolacea]